MTNRKSKALFKNNPVIAAVRSPKQLQAAIESSSDIVFLLCGNIFNLGKMVSLLKQHNKIVFVHLDLIKGFAQDSYFVKYLAQEIQVDGVISTKNSILQRARQEDLITVQRIFMLDSNALESSVSSVQKVLPNAVEVLPGCCPKLIRLVKEKIEIPIITGGFVNTKEEVINELKAGALSCSTSDDSLWSLKLE